MFWHSLKIFCPKQQPYVPNPPLPCSNLCCPYWTQSCILWCHLKHNPQKTSGLDARGYYIPAVLRRTSRCQISINNPPLGREAVLSTQILSSCINIQPFVLYETSIFHVARFICSSCLGSLSFRTHIPSNPTQTHTNKHDKHTVYQAG